MAKLSESLFPSSPTLIKQLLRAYADEWFGHYNYFLVSHLVQGPSSKSVASLLIAKSDACFVRAEKIVRRLRELGLDVIPKLPELVEHATDKPFKLPEKHDDIERLLAAVLDAERTSIRTFDLIRDLSSDDPITLALALSLLAEAVAGEQELETLLGDSAPAFDGA